MSEGNPFLTRLRRRQGIWGAFHRSNLGPLAAAILLYLATAFYLWRLGWGGIIGTLVVFHVVMLLFALLAATATISRQVRLARKNHTWDELVLTLLSDRDLVNGQLFLALRPIGLLLRLASPVLIVLLICAVWEFVIEEGIAEALRQTLLLVAGLALFYALAATTVLCVAVMSFHRALTSRGALLGIMVIVGAVVLLVAAPFFAPLLVPLVCLLPGIAWYQHRVLCCTLRQHLLANR